MTLNKIKKVVKELDEKLSDRVAANPIAVAAD